MKTHNEKILSRTKTIHEKSLEKSTHMAHMVTHPSDAAAIRGASISSYLGLILMLAGIVGLILSKHLLYSGFIVIGVLTMVINLVRLRVKRDKLSKLDG